MRFIILFFILILMPAAALAETFYLSAKYAENYISYELSGETWSYGGGYEGIVDPESGKIVVSPGVSRTYKVPGGSSNKSSRTSGLFIGIDLYEEYALPLRFEVGGIMRSTINSDFSEFHVENGSGDNSMPPRIDTFGAWQHLKSESYSFMLNGYIDFHNPTPFTPYIGGGIGLTGYSVKITENILIEYRESLHVPGINAGSKSSYEKFSIKENGWAFTWNVTAGVAYEIVENVKLDLSYSYIHINDINISPVWKGKYGIHQLDVSASGQTLSESGHQLMLSMRFGI